VGARRTGYQARVTTSESTSVSGRHSASATGGGRPDHDPARGEDAPEDLAHLVKRMQQGDEQSLKQLYEATVGKVHALSRAILRNPQDAEENTCETFATAWATAYRFDATRGTVMTWLLVLCRSRAIDKLRRSRHQRATIDVKRLEDLEPVVQAGPEDWLELLQQGTRAHQALSRLSLQRRQLVGLAFLQGLTHAEIAQHCRLPLGTVKSHLRRALSELRTELQLP
jgi:RNA polymerase sigma-70 factor (ECF subfamily)